MGRKLKLMAILSPIGYRAKTLGKLETHMVARFSLKAFVNLVVKKKVMLSSCTC